MKTIRASLPILCVLSLFGCVTNQDALPEGDGSESKHVLFDALHKVAPELRTDELAIIAIGSIKFPHASDWQQGGRVLAGFRYRRDPERRSRLLVLRRTFPADRSAPTLLLEICHAHAHHLKWEGTVDYPALSLPRAAQAHTQDDDDCVCDNGLTRWIILDRHAYDKEPTHA